MTDTAESLDPLRLPLIGERLIEASAGTGKTFTIAALYLRLLLGLGGEAAYPRAISVEELLVVTFTEAATEELRGRIRSQIIPFGEVHRRLELAGAPCEPEQIGISRARFRASFEKIPYMRSRYTVIDVACRCGWMEEWLDRLFGKGGVWQVESHGQIGIGQVIPAASGM